MAKNKTTPLERKTILLNKALAELNSVTQERDSLKRVCEEQAERAANPPQRALSLAEQILVDIANHNECLGALNSQAAELSAQQKAVGAAMCFHSEQLMSLKRGLTQL